MNINKYLDFGPFSLNKNEKQKLFNDLINHLTNHHYKSCKEYNKFLKFLNYKPKKNKLSQIPFLPTSAFKKFTLTSIPKKEIFKTLTSSGTSGNPSKIFLNKENANNQRKVLTKIIGTILGKERIPCL